MWARNLLFIGLCLVGLTALGNSLFRRDQLQVVKHLQRQGSPQRRGVPPTEPATQRSDISDVVGKIDAEFAAAWNQHQIAAPNQADRLTLVRRLSLALTGAVPSLEEVRAIETFPDHEAIPRWTAYLLDDPRYFDYMAERWARVFVGTDDGPFIFFRRRRFVSYLSDHLRRDTRYDALVRELISDQGLWTDSPAVNYVTSTFNPDSQLPDPIRLAGRTSRAFLGLRLDCLQCHDDNLNKMDLASNGDRVEGTQRHFHELASFFGQSKGTARGLREDAEKAYECTLLGDEKASKVDPKVPFGDEYFGAEHVGDRGTRREKLAKWITDPKNMAFSRTTVNRVWAMMFGKPLVEPIDEIPLRGPYPPALETLAHDFIDHDFDLKRLIQVIAETKAFRASSEASGDEPVDDEKMELAEKHWAAFPITRMRPEQVAGSVIQASSLRAIDGDSNIVWKLVKFGNTNNFVTRYGDLGQDEFTERGGTIPQRLLLMNGELVQERTNENIVLNATTRLSTLTQSNDRIIEAAYLAILTRRPTPEEHEHFLKRFEGVTGRDRMQLVQDLYWTLLNSTEFSWNH